MGFRVEQLRQDFPLLQKDKPVVYFDNACMTLRPRQVIDKVREYYEEYPACAGRSIHRLSQRVDEEVYKARRSVQKLVGAGNDKEIIFLRNATEGVNLVARGFPFEKGDVILVGDKEHNSNLLPWLEAARRKRLTVDVVDSNDDNTFSLDNLKAKLEEHAGRVRLASFGATSNLDGVSIPAKEVARAVHKAGAKVFFDAAQTVPHHVVDTRSFGADFIAFSGHKMLGPSGIGALWGDEESLLSLDHYNVGGETVMDTTYHEPKWEGLPHRFEAGLQHYAGIIGLGEASRYLMKTGLKGIARHESSLNKRLHEGLTGIKGFSFIGPKDPVKRGGITSFNLEGLQYHDVATMLSASDDIMIRSGAHCVHSWFNKHGLQGSARASLYLYNTEAEVDRFLESVKDLSRMVK